MQEIERTLTPVNIDRIIKEYTYAVDGLGSSIAGKTGLPLLEAMKRKRL